MFVIEDERGTENRTLEDKMNPPPIPTFVAIMWLNKCGNISLHTQACPNMQAGAILAFHLFLG